jgi:hypothetical protein
MTPAGTTAVIKPRAFTVNAAALVVPLKITLLALTKLAPAMLPRDWAKKSSARLLHLRNFSGAWNHSSMSRYSLSHVLRHKRAPVKLLHIITDVALLVALAVNE